VKKSADGKLKLTPPMQLVCLQGWGMLQLANARLRAHFFTPFKGAVFSAETEFRDYLG
jgi:hypothetical protein